jgi:CRISPR-associated protein Cas8a1/Csx13
MASAMKKEKPKPPSRLTMRLFDPGMSPLHRAGLGGLACTLKYIEEAHGRGEISPDRLPGVPWKEGRPPWVIDRLKVILDFGRHTGAAEFLKRLFAIAFQIKDGLIYLPAQWEQPPSLAVMAKMQAGLTLTFLQHGRVRKLAESRPLQHDPDGRGTPVTFEFKECSSYKHQAGWKSLCDNHGSLRTKPVEVIGPLSPGSVVRHVAFTSQTKLVDDPARVLVLHFATVGCVALPVNRGTGVLLVPEVTDLRQFASDRTSMTPTSMRECRITGPGDAALQFQLRLRAKRLISANDLPACHAILFQPTPWAKQQKSRVNVVHVPPGDEAVLDQFEVALAELPPRIVERLTKEKRGRGKAAEVIEKQEWFWVDSVVRPLVADNLAQSRPWYAGFVDLMTKLDPASKRPLRAKVIFEKRGLHAMIEKMQWKDRGESTVVRAVHEAIRCRFGEIAQENHGSPVAMKKRWNGEYDRRRLAFAGAKTADQLRHALCDLFARAGTNSVLKKDWQEILPMLVSDRWQLTRDLALLALASYSGKDADETDGDPESNQAMDADA